MTTAAPPLAEIRLVHVPAPAWPADAASRQFLVQENGDRSYPFSRTFPVFAEAVDCWLAQGTERCDLFAWCERPAGDGMYAEACSRWAKGTWGPWRDA